MELAFRLLGREPLQRGRAARACGIPDAHEPGIRRDIDAQRRAENRIRFAHIEPRFLVLRTIRRNLRFIDLKCARIENKLLHVTAPLVNREDGRSAYRMLIEKYVEVEI